MTETINRPIFMSKAEIAKRFADPAVTGGITFGFVTMLMLMLSCGA